MGQVQPFVTTKTVYDGDGYVEHPARCRSSARWAIARAGSTRARPGIRQFPLRHRRRLRQRSPRRSGRSEPLAGPARTRRFPRAIGHAGASPGARDPGGPARPVCCAQRDLSRPAGTRADAHRDRRVARGPRGRPVGGRSARSRSTWGAGRPRLSARSGARGADREDMGTSQGMSRRALWLGLLRPLPQRLGKLVFDASLRRPREGPLLPTAPIGADSPR